MQRDEFGCDYESKTVGESITKYNIPDDWIAEFDAYDEMGFKSKKYLLCEIMGKYANLIFADENGKIIVVDDILTAIEVANEIAPEHLELCVDNPFDYLDRIKHAGSIFMGRNCPEALGDYFAGPNHILPTNGTAKFFGPLSVDDFVKKSSIIYYSREALEPIHKDIIKFATSEQLTAHANSIKVRFEES